MMRRHFIGQTKYAWQVYVKFNEEYEGPADANGIEFQGGQI